MAAVFPQKRFSDNETSFVIRYFDQFYDLLSRLHHGAIHDPWQGPNNGDTVQGNDNRVGSARSILAQLKELLDRQGLECQKYGGQFAVTYYQNAQFVMAALADELFLKADWTGRSFWEDNLLESALFGTHDAGDLFFTRLDDLLNLRDPLQKDVAEIYLMALGLGFEGRYRGTDHGDILDHYRRTLYTFIHKSEPSFDRDGMRLCPEAYVHTLSSGSFKLFNDMRMWGYAFGGIVITLLLVSAIVWHNGTAKTNDTLDGILTPSSDANRP